MTSGGGRTLTAPVPAGGGTGHVTVDGYPGRPDGWPTVVGMLLLVVLLVVVVEVGRARPPRVSAPLPASSATPP